MDYLMNVVNESPIHTMMYHGSDLELDRLKPTAYNAGHRLKSHSWSVFLWPTFELAYKWAAFVTCRNLGRALKGKVDKWRPLGEHIKTGFNKYEFKVYVHREAYDTVRKYICDQEPMFYVYTVNTPIDTKFSVGNNNIQPEYSYDGELSIYHKEEYQLTERLFEEIFEPCDEAKYQELKAFKGENIRGPIGILFYPSDDVVKRWSFVYKRVQQGAIKPGDDLDPVIAEYEQHEELTKQSIIMSQDDLYLNYEKWESGESHSLMVYGLSGSGKSTLGQKIADENDAHYVSTDVIGFMIVGPRNAAKGRTTYEFIRKTDIMLYTFFKLYNIPPDVLADIEYDPITKTPTPEDEQRKRDLADKFIHWLVFEQKEKVVIEGSYTGVTITNHPDDYKDIPIIFKGTSLLKSVHRRAIRNLKNGDPIEAIHLIIKIKSQYLDHMMPEVNAARSTMLKDRYDYRLVKEDLIDEGMKFGELDIDAPNPHVKHKKHKIPVPSNIKDFKDFCARIPNPEVSMAWFIKNKVKWTPHGGSNDHPFQWPDYLIKQKMGNCFDQTIFMHYYCQKKRIDHRMFLITWISDKGEGTGHAVPMYMKGKYVYIWLYFRPGVGTIAGPYRSYEEAKTTLDYYFSVAMNRLFKSPTYAYSSFISSEDMARFDEYYNDRSITQTQYICDGLGANLRSTHMVKLKYKGFTFPNPAVPIYDVVITAIQLLKFANNLVPTREDTDFVEEIYLDRDIDKSMDPLKLNPAKDYRDFNDFCSKVHTIPMMLKWFIDNVSWPDPIVDLRIRWPDELVKTKIGICTDHAIFMYYFCKRLGLASRLMQVLWADKDDKCLGGHAGIVFRYRDKYYCPFFLPKCGWIAGPYNTWDEARLNFQRVMEGYGNYYTRQPTYTYSVLLEDEDHKVLDKYYNKPVSQDIFDGCTSLTYYRLHYKGYSAPDPMVWVADVMKAAAERILYHREKSWVESVEEAGADSKYTKNYRDFNEFCTNIHTPYEVLNWYRVNFVKWNSPDKDGHLNRKPFTWPDDMIKTKTGNCGDHAIFMHYFCERHHIPNYIIRLTRNWLTRDSNEYHIGQHFTCVFKDDAGWFGFDYSGGPMRADRARFYSIHSALSGPYPSAEAYAEESARVMDYTMSRMGLANLRRVEKCEYHFLTKENLELLDRLYGRHDVMQIDYYMMIRKDIQSKYDFQTYEEDDPIDWAMNKIQQGIYKAKSLITHEDTTLINEDKKMDKAQLVKSFKSIKTFDDFCKTVPNPEAMLLWFIYNKVEWHVDDNKHPIQWPDDIIATKKGICFDHAIFMHYYCERKRIPNRIMIMSWVPDKGKITGHVILIYEHKGQYYCPIYMSKGYGWMTGPYRSWEEARQNLHEIHAGAVAYYGSRSPVTPYSSLLDDRDMKVLDEYYGRHDVTSQQVLEKFRSSHLYKLRFRGMLFPNPLLFFEDLFGQLYHKLSRARGDYWSWSEDANLITEAKDIYVDRFGNKKAKGDSIYIGTDANASESEYLKRVEYIRLSTIRNGTPQPVIMKNGGSYRARCEVIVLKGNKILLDRGKNRGGFGYTLPGGGIDPREKVAKGAARECEEEALVKPKHVKFMNVVWWGEFENPLFNKGSVSMVCVAEFGSYYDESKVKQEDRDEFADRAQWEDYRTANLGEPHMIAIERYFGRDVKPKTICTLEETITEAKLKPEERTNYGLPKKKKYPMPDKAHVLQAIRMFNHCDPEDEEELARNIIKNMKKYNMKDVKVGKNNRFHKYYHPDNKALDESLRMESYKVTAFINESIRLLEIAGGGGPVIGMEINDQSVQFSTPGQFLINFSDTPDTRKNDYAISNDLSSKYIYRKKKDKYIKEDATTFLKDKTIRIYRFLGEQSLWLTLLRDIDINVCDEETSIYEDLTGKKELSYDQIDYDDNFEYFDLSKYLLESSMFKTTVDLETAKLHGDKRYEFTLPNQDLSKRYIIKEDQKGQFLYDQLTGNRSPSLTRR